MSFGYHSQPSPNLLRTCSSLCGIDHSSFQSLSSLNLLLPTPSTALSTDEMSLIQATPVSVEPLVGLRRISWETKLLSTVRGGKPV